MDDITYQKLCMRTAKPLDKQTALIHGALGCGSDMGELATTIKAHLIYGKELDLVNIKEEIGDVSWFIAYTAHETDMLLSHVVSRKCHHAVFFSKNQHLGYWTMAGMIFAGKINDAVIGMYGTGQIGSYHLENGLVGLHACLVKIAEIVGLNIGDVREANIEKLRKRYPDKYTDEAALARADKV